MVSKIKPTASGIFRGALIGLVIGGASFQVDTVVNAEGNYPEHNISRGMASVDRSLPSVANADEMIFYSIDDLSKPIKGSKLKPQTKPQTTKTTKKPLTNKTNKITTTNKTENPTPPPSNTSKYDYSSMKGNFSKSKAFVKDGIKVSYKNNTYNTNNQAEYDQVMNHVAKIVSAKSYGEMRGKDMEREKEKLHILEDLMNGKITPITQRSHPNYRDVDNQQALGYLDAFEEMINSGVSFDTLAKFSSASYYNTELTAGHSAVFGPPESAYDFFIKDYVDCTSSAYAKQAVYDALGFNTAVVHSPGANHDYLIVELDGKWFKEFEGTSFTKEDVLKGDFIKFAPAKHADALSFINIR